MSNRKGRERRNVMVTVALTEGERDYLRSVSDEVGVPQAEILRSAGLREADRRLADHRRMAVGA